MGDDPPDTAGEAQAVDQAGMVGGIGDRPVAGAQEGREEADVRLVAAGEEEGRLGPLEAGEPRLQGEVGGMSAGEEARGRSAERLAFGQGGEPGEEVLPERRIVRQAQVVVRGEIEAGGDAKLTVEPRRRELGQALAELVRERLHEASGWSPSLARSARSWSSPGLGVVKSRSPVKIELAPARRQRAWVSADMAVRPAERRTRDRGSTMRAVAIIRTRSSGSTAGRSARAASGVPATRTRALTGTLSGWGSMRERTPSSAIRSASASPMPRMPPQQTAIPAARTRSRVWRRSS